MRRQIRQILAVLLAVAALAAIVVPTHALKLTEKEYAELFEPVYGPLGDDFADKRLEAAFREDPLGFVQALAKEKYSNMFSVIDGRMGDWSSDPSKHDLRNALLQVAYGEKLTQPERRVVRWMLLCTKVMEDYPLYTGEIDYQELFSHILTGEHAGLTDEIRLAFDHDPEALVKALAKESTRVKESVLLDLAFEHYYLNPSRTFVKQAMDHLQMYGDLNDAELQIVADFWKTVDEVVGPSGVLPDFQEYEHRAMLAKGVTLTDEAEIEAWRKEAETLFLNDPKSFLNALPWEYEKLYHTLELLIDTPWFADSEKTAHMQVLQGLTDDSLSSNNRRAVKWMLMFSEDWQQYEAYEIYLQYSAPDGTYAALIGQIQHTDVITADLLGQELYRAYLVSPENFFYGLFHYADYTSKVSALLVKASYEARGSVGEISANLWKIQDVLGQQRMVLDEFRAAVQWREEYLIHTTDAPYYVPPTQPPTTQTPTSQPDQKPKTEPVKIPTGWILTGLVAVIFVVQIVAVIVVRKKQKQQYDDFDTDL